MRVLDFFNIIAIMLIIIALFFSINAYKVAESCKLCDIKPNEAMIKIALSIKEFSH